MKSIFLVKLLGSFSVCCLSPLFFQEQCKRSFNNPSNARSHLTHSHLPPSQYRAYCKCCIQKINNGKDETFFQVEVETTKKHTHTQNIQVPCCFMLGVFKRTNKVGPSPIISGGLDKGLEQARTAPPSPIESLDDQKVLALFTEGSSSPPKGKRSRFFSQSKISQPIRQQKLSPKKNNLSEDTSSAVGTEGFQPAPADLIAQAEVILSDLKRMEHLLPSSRLSVGKSMSPSETTVLHPRPPTTLKSCCDKNHIELL